MKDLLISLQGIGNTLLITPVLKYLHNKGETLDAVISDNNSHNILKALGILRNVYIYREDKGFIRNALELKGFLYKNNYDAIYAMYPNGKRENFLSFYLGKRNICGFKDKRDYWRMLKFLIEEKVMLYKDGHDILNNFKLIGAPSTYKDYKPFIAIPPQIDEEIRKKYLKKDRRPLLVLHPSSGQEKKRWDINSYRYICQRLAREKGIKIIIAGSPSDEEIIDSIMGDIDGGMEKFTHTNILYTAALIKYCNLFLGNDSSLMHISSCLEKPTVAIWGFTDYKRTSPYGKNSLIIRKAFSCSPCYSFEYNYSKRCTKDFYCLKGLDKERIYDIISFIIDNVKNGKELKDLDFGWVNNIDSIQTLWSKCKVINLL